MTRLSVVATALTVVGCVSRAPDPASNPAEVRAAIEKVNQAWAAGAEAGDAKAIAALLTENVTLMNPDLKDVVGRAAFESDYARLVAERSFVVESQQIVTDSVEVRGDRAYEVGHSISVRRAKTGPAAKADTLVFRYITFWEKGADGQWRPNRDFTVQVPSKK